MMHQKVVLVLTVLALSVSICFAAPINFTEGFDGVAPGGELKEWIFGGDKDATATVVDSSAVEPHTAPHSLFLSDQSTQGSAIIIKEMGEQAKGTLKFAVYKPTAGPGDFYCTLNKGEERVLDVQLSGSFNLQNRDTAGKLQKIGKYTANVWHIVEISWDVKNATYSWSVDGAKVGDFAYIKAVAPDRVIFKSGSTDKVGHLAYIDSVEIKAE